MAILNTTPQHRGPELLLTHTQKLGEDTAKTAKDFDDLGKKVDKVRVGFETLSRQVKRTDEIFTKAASAFGGGRISSATAVMKFLTEADKLNRSFTQSFSHMRGGLTIISSESQNALKHIQHYGTGMIGYLDKRAERQQNWLKLQNEEVMLAQDIAEEQKKNLGFISQGLLKRQDTLKQSRTVLSTIEATAEAEKDLAFVGAAFALTVGEAAFSAHKMLNTFKDVKLTMREAMGITERMFSGSAAARGLVSMEKMAEIMHSLRGEGLSYFKDQQLVKTIAQIHAATNMSVQALADMAREMRTLGGPGNRSMQELGDSMTYFAQQSELGADEVAQVVKSAQPLIADFPRKMQSATVTSILAVASAFKKVGLNIDEALKGMEDMQDLTNSEGMKRAAMFSSYGGGNMSDIISGKMSPGQMGAMQMRAQFNAMKQMMSGGMNIQTSASILSKMGLGNVADLKTMGRKTPQEEKEEEDNIARTEREATAQKHLADALNRLIGDPINKLESLFVTMRAVLFGAGERVINVIANMFEQVGKLAPVKATIDTLNDMFQTLTSPEGVHTMVLMLTPLLVQLPLLVVKSFTTFQARIGDLIRTFAKAGADMTKFGEAVIFTTKALAGETKQQLELAGSANTATVAKEKETLANKEGTGAQMLMPFMSGAGATGGTVAKVEGGIETGVQVAATMTKTGMFSRIGNLFGAGKRKIMSLGGGAATKIIGAGKGMIKGVAGFASKMPGIGVMIGAAFGLSSLVSRVQDENSPMSWVQGILDVVGGIVGGLGPIGIIASLAIQGVNGILDWFRGKKKSDDEEKNKKEAEEQKATGPGLGGRSPLTWGGGNAGSNAGGVETGVAGAGGPIRAEAYGPNSEGATSADKRQIKGNHGNMLQPGDYAVSEDLAQGHRPGEKFQFTDAGGNVHTGVYADTSMKSPGNKNFRTIEQWNGKDLGTVSNLRWIGSGDGSTPTTSPTTAPTTAGSQPNASPQQQAGGVQTSVTATGGAQATVNGQPIGGAGQPAEAGGDSGAALANFVTGRTMATPWQTDIREGCASSVSKMLADAGYDFKFTPSTNGLYDECRQKGWKEVPLGTPGAIVVAPDAHGTAGHSGIMGNDGKIWANSSATGMWHAYGSVQQWERDLGGGRHLTTHCFLPGPATKKAQGVSTSMINRSASTAVAQRVSMAHGGAQTAALGSSLMNRFSAPGTEGTPPDPDLKKLTASTLDMHRRQKDQMTQDTNRRFNDRTLLDDPADTLFS